MTTLADLKSRIANDLARDDLTDQIAAAIADAISWYETQSWSWLQTETDISTVAETASYDLPTGFREMRLLTITVDDTRAPCRPVSYEEVREALVSTTASSGRPFQYALWQEKIWFLPIPDAVYTATCSYIKAIGAPATDGADNQWTTTYEPLVRARAKAYLFANVIRGPEAFQDAQVQQGIEADWRNRLRRLSYHKSGSGEIRPRYV